jgi:hypothetical protein
MMQYQQGMCIMQYQQGYAISAGHPHLQEVGERHQISEVKICFNAKALGE